MSINNVIQFYAQNSTGKLHSRATRFQTFQGEDVPRLSSLGGGGLIGPSVVKAANSIIGGWLQLNLLKPLFVLSLCIGIVEKYL